MTLAVAQQAPSRVVKIIATLFGDAVTLGLGVIQITRGIGHIGRPNPTLTIQVTAVLTIAFALSAVAGISGVYSCWRTSTCA